MKKTGRKRRFLQKDRTLGLPPGTIISPEGGSAGNVRITVFDYDQDHVEEREVRNIEECYDFRDQATTTWINIDGVHDTDLISKIDSHFGIHPLILEDIVQTGQRPKLDDFGSYLFILFKMVYWNADEEDVNAEQVSLLAGTNYVISFQEKPGDVFDKIRERIRQGKGRIRKMGADYLAYCLLDAVVDNYFLVLEKFDETETQLDERIMNGYSIEVSRQLHTAKRNLIFLKKQIWPLRDVIGGMIRSESRLIQDSTDIYLRDLYDHTIQVMDSIESFREMLSGLHDVYLAMMSNRMNEVMKVLTIFAAIFIPLTFIAGVYGMNFDYMPELHWKWGYAGVLGVMTMLALGMIIFFRRKKWI